MDLDPKSKYELLLRVNHLPGGIGRFMLELPLPSLTILPRVKNFSMISHLRAKEQSQSILPELERPLQSPKASGSAQHVHGQRLYSGRVLLRFIIENDSDTKSSISMKLNTKTNQNTSRHMRDEGSFSRPVSAYVHFEDTNQRDISPRRRQVGNFPAISR